MTSNNQTCPTVFVPDVPAADDAFGTHEPIAKAIGALITEEAGGISIALEGRWGSGKSTIVRILKKHLEGMSPNNAVVVFDAWAHEGDPLRRTFLEALIEWFIARPGWIHDKASWQRTKDVIGKRLKNERIKQTPSIGFWGFLFGIAVLLTPISLVIVSHAMDESHLGWISVGVSLALLPVGVALLLGAYILFVLARNKLRSDSSKTDPDPGAAGAVIFQRTTTRTTTESYETPDPTSVEFGSEFSKLMKEVLKNDQRRVVIVLDNLDRIARDEARSILSTMQTFLEGNANAPWFDRLWIVMPYDLDGIRGLWREESDPKAENDDIARRFLEKRFQIRFHVPPFALSDWDEYLTDLLTTAFPEHPKVDDKFHSVFRAYDASRKKTGLPPTPRELKLLVNQIGAIHRVWGDDIPLAHMAYYSTLFLSGKNIIKSLRKREIPNQQLINMLGIQITDSLASISFNTDSEKALELLLLEDLQAALAAGNGDELVDLASKHPSGAWLVLERVPFSDWASTESEKLFQTAKALSHAEFISSAPASVTNSVLASLIGAVKSVESWEPYAAETGEGLAALLDMKPEVNLASAALKSLSASPVVADEEGENAENIGNWTEALVPIVQRIVALRLEESLSEGVLIPGNAEWCVEVCALLAQERISGKLAPHLRTSATDAELTEYATERITTGQSTPRILGGFDVLGVFSPSLSWDQIVEAAFQRLNGVSALPPDEILSLVMLFWKFEDRMPASIKRLQQLCSDGHLLHHLHHARQKESADATSLCLISQLVFHPLKSAPENPVGNSTDGWNYMDATLKSPADHGELLTSFLENLEKLGQANKLLEMLDSSPQWKPWFVASLTEAIAQGEVLTYISTSDYRSRHEFLWNEIADDKYNAMVSELVADGGLAEELTAETFNPDEAQIYVDALRGTKGSHSKYCEWLIDGMKALPAEDWVTSFQNETYLLDLGVETYELCGDFKLDLPYRDAVWRFADRVIQGEQAPEDPAITSGSFLKPVLGEDRAAMRSRLLASAKQAEGEISQPFFGIFGGEISQVEMLSQDRDIVMRLFEPLVRVRNEPGLIWLADLLDANPKFLEGDFPKYAVAEFSDRVAEAAKESSPDEEAYSALARIAKVMKIEIDNSESQEDSQETEE